jgi:2-amino-4-hydroxy-6-hydroxymethyldihydropteridine diphosphokinase
MAIVYLSLGSNVEDRMEYLTLAEEKLSGHSDIEILKLSKVYETEPWPLHEVEDKKGKHPHAEEGRKWFLNQVIQIKTQLPPAKLLAVAQKIETELGRTAKNDWGDREIDIDILLYDQDTLDSPNLEIPHRHMNDREFVLIPLLEIAPKLVDPISGELYADILREIKSSHKVVPFL